MDGSGTLNNAIETEIAEELVEDGFNGFSPLSRRDRNLGRPQLCVRAATRMFVAEPGWRQAMCGKSLWRRAIRRAQGRLQPRLRKVRGSDRRSARRAGGSSPFIRIPISGGFRCHRAAKRSALPPREWETPLARPRGKPPRLWFFSPTLSRAHERGFHGRDEKTGAATRSESPRAASPEPHGNASGFSLGRLAASASRNLSPPARSLTTATSPDAASRSLGP